MAEDIFKPKGQAKEFKPDAGGAAVRNAPVLAVVKDNIDPARTGRLRVYISDIGGFNPDDAASWVTVNYMSPFYGFTPGSPPETGYGNYQLNSTSYGMWTSPPDVGSTVLCIFVNGDPNFGYWIGCVPNPEKLTMVPAIGGQKVVVPNEQEAKSVGGAKILPVTNMNDNDPKLSQSPTYYDAPKPINSYVVQTLNYQGLLRDNVRGVISSSAQRETPSRVGFGVSTPGRPIYKGGADDSSIVKDVAHGNTDKTQIVSRRPGHTFVMDDGDIVGKDQLIRLRTSLGHQILMSDDGQCLFIIHANGRSWVELGKEGTIDMYATNSVNIRTQGDLNLHADRNVNIHANGDLNLKGDNVNIEAEKNFTERAGTNHVGYAGGIYTYKATAGISLSGGAVASLSATGPTFIKGNPLFLNTGMSPLQPIEIPKIPLKFHIDTLYDSTKGWAAAPGKLVSITSRAPAHAPWAYAGLGVDVQVNNNAASSLPSAPNPAVTQANQTNQTQPSNPTTPSLVSTVPVTPSAGGASTLDPATSSAMISQIAKQAAENPVTKAAVQAGKGIVQTPNGPTAVVGALAATPEQLEQGGYIKPGSAALVNSLIQGGKTIEEAYTNNLFTGKDGINSIQEYINKVPIQVNNAYTNFGQAERALIKAGTMTGNESGTSTAGMIMSAATEGVAKTVSYVKDIFSSTIKNATGAVSGLFSGATGSLSTNLSGAFQSLSGSLTSQLAPLSNLGGSLSNMFGNTSQAFSAGNFAAGLGSNVMSGLSGLATSMLSSVTSQIFSRLPGLTTLSKIFENISNIAKGISEASFKRITSSFPNLTPNQPNNLEQLANKATANAQDPQSTAQDKTTASAVASGSSSAANNPFYSGDYVLNNFNQAKSNLASSLNSVTTNLTNNVSALAETGIEIANTRETVLQNSSTSSGLDLLPGGTSAVASVVDNAKSTISSLPSLAPIQNVTKAFTSAVTTVTNPISNLGSSAMALFDKLRGGASSLTSLVSFGTPSASSAQLQSALKSLSAVSSSAKPAVVATNTDKTSPNTSSFLPKGVPAPNYTGVTAESAQQAESQLKQVKLAAAVESRNLFQQSTLLPAQNAYENAKKELPAGDPEIERLYVVLQDAYAQLQLIEAEIKSYS